MFNKFVLSLAVISTLITTAPLFVLAQTTDAKREKREQEVKQKIQKLGTGQKAVVKVKLHNDTEYKGYVSRANDSDFEVIDTAGSSHVVPYADVRSIGGKNLSTGAKIGIGVGIGAAATILIILVTLSHLD
jgi:hypothetical protein